MQTQRLALLPLLLLLVCVRLNAQQFYFSSEKPTACGQADGIVTIVPTRGIPPFTYQWNTGATDLSLRNVPKGVYTATLTDASGATVVHTHYLNSHEFDIYPGASLPATWCNPNSGAITVLPQGGQAPYTYTWSNGQSSDAIAGLTVGAYTVTAVDATGCSAAGVFEVRQDFSHNPYARIETVQAPDCANPSNGELKAVPLYNSYPPFVYNWNTGASAEVLSGVPAGMYTVTITDALGCTVSTSATVQKAMVTNGSVVCSGGVTGTASAQLVNATAPVAYSWSNGQSGPFLNNLGNGAYAVTATDAAGCSSESTVLVVVPELTMADNSPKCYAGNNGVGNCWVNNDNAVAYSWDNGVTDAWNSSLGAGPHSVTVSTALGCTLTGTINIAAPQAAPMEIQIATTPADCANSIAGGLNVTITGGIQPYTFFAYGENGFSTSDLASLQQIQGGKYTLYAYSKNFVCSTYEAVVVPDNSGFNPELTLNQIDCTTGFGSAVVTGVTTPGAQYAWSMGANTPDVYNLTPGCYSATVTGGGTCQVFFNFCLFSDDSIQTSVNCFGLLSGSLINDQGTAGCNGALGIPFQMIQVQPSGALHFTDANGVYQISVPAGNFDIQPAHYDPGEIACPAGGAYSVSPVTGATLSGLDFHYFSSSTTDNRVTQRPLRTAQPGYPYSLRVEVCNDGGSSSPGTLDLAYGNFLGSLAASSFAQHPGIFTLTSETPGAPDNAASFSFSGIQPGFCELLQADLITPTGTPVNQSFRSEATVSPASGDPTPDNNISTIHSAVVGSFDPNSVLVYPVRNGNPHDGGELFRQTDQHLSYQIYFQNTGNAPANLVVVRDTLDPNLDVASIRSVNTSHDVQLSLEDNNRVLVFRFPNINLPDSTSDYANSIGSIQYQVDLAPNLPIGTEVHKKAAIYFDFNGAILTNENVLTLTDVSSTEVAKTEPAVLLLTPNPADGYFSLLSPGKGNIQVFTSAGALAKQQGAENGLQRVYTGDLPDGIYFIRLTAAGSSSSGKLVVRH